MFEVAKNQISRVKALQKAEYLKTAIRTKAQFGVNIDVAARLSIRPEPNKRYHFTFRFHFSGLALTTELRIPEDRFVQPQTGTNVSVNEGSTPDKFRSAIAAPLNFPALKDVVFAGDSIAIAVMSDLNSPAASLDGLLESIASEHLTASKLSIVSSFEIKEVQDAQEQSWQDRFSEDGIELSFVVHNPDDQNEVAYMAASYAGDPIYVNRNLFDADMIIPLTSPSPSNPEFERLLYPEFSTTETKTRFQDPAADPQVLRSEVRHANELVGASFVVSSIPGIGGVVDQVFAGDPLAVSKMESNSNKGWSLKRMPEGKVVVATIEADASRQNWDQFFQALSAAAMAADNTEQIIICTQLSNPPEGIHRELLQLQFETDYEKINQFQKTLPDHLRHISGILEEMSVFVKSDLSESDVEELGFGHIENEKQLQRIIDNAESGIFLRDAHLCNISGEA